MFYEHLIDAFSGSRRRVWEGHWEASGRDLSNPPHPYHPDLPQCALAGEGVRRSDQWRQKAEASRQGNWKKSVQLVICMAHTIIYTYIKTNNQNAMLMLEVLNTNHKY